MAKRARYQNRIELLQGTLDLLILQTLQWGPQHGYGIAQAIQAGSSDVLQVDTGSLYPALHRLERQKLDRRHVEDLRQQAAHARLSPDRGRPAAARVRALALADAGRRDERHPRQAAGG